MTRSPSVIAPRSTKRAPLQSTSAVATAMRRSTVRSSAASSRVAAAPVARFLRLCLVKACANVPSNDKDESAGAGPGVKREGEALRRGVQLVAQGGQHRVTREREAEGVVVGGKSPQARERDPRHRRKREQRPRVECG